jgi:flagellar hook-length control protein FliK
VQAGSPVLPQLASAPTPAEPALPTAAVPATGQLPATPTAGTTRAVVDPAVPGARFGAGSPSAPLPAAGTAALPSPGSEPSSDPRRPGEALPIELAPLTAVAAQPAPVGHAAAPSPKPVGTTTPASADTAPVVVARSAPDTPAGSGEGSGKDRSPDRAGAAVAVGSASGTAPAHAFEALHQAQAGQPDQPLTAAAAAQAGVAQPVANLDSGVAVPTVAAPPAAGQPVPHQLARPLLNLRASGDGIHQLTIALHPADLGPVNVHVRLVGDAMTIQLASTTEGARSALHEALPQLRQELQNAGMSSVDLSLDLNSQSSAGSQREHWSDQSPGQQAARAAPEPVRPAQPSSGTRPARQLTELDRWL